jgi:glycosyltransferase involved in cell wall biosynthesis
MKTPVDAVSIDRFEPDICLFIADLRGGGAERVCYILANAWAGKGLNVLLIVMRPESGQFKKKLDSRVRLHSLNCTRSRFAFGVLKTLLRRLPSTPVIVFGFELAVPMTVLKMTKLIKTPFIYREGSDPQFQVTSTRKWFYRLLLHFADGCIAQCQHVKRQILALGRKELPIEVIYNPGPAFCRTYDRPMRDVCGIKLLGVGRLDKNKAFDRLLRAFQALTAIDKDAQLKVAGIGPEESSLKGLAKALDVENRVELSGFCQEVEKLYIEADVFVLSSYYEGMPNVLVEALSAGCRVLAAGGPTVRELLDTIGLNDCFLEDADFGELFARRVADVLRIPPERWREAQARLKQMTDLQGVADKYLQFCKSVTSA